MRPLATLNSIVAAGLLVASCATSPGSAGAVWKLDRLDSIGGHVPEVLGSPKALRTNGNTALCFDGKADGLFIPVNPIQGFGQFTIEVRLRPDGDGAEEQRFLHIQDGKEQRVLIETRVTKERTWALDTFLRASDTDRLTLLDRSQMQATDRWYWVALSYDGTSMRHYVNGNKQLEGTVAFPATEAGRMSLGVRQNRIHWFKGCIAEVRFHPLALDPAKLARD
jgi:hypothetical protein